jgi:hypothetical protein
MKTRTAAGKIERQQQRIRGPGKRHDGGELHSAAPLSYEGEEEGGLDVLLA